MQDFNPYDPEEMRRRQMLAMDTEGDASDASVMAPDEEELPASQTEQSVPTVGTNRSVSPAEMTAAQRHYSQTMSQMPTPDQFVNSRGRRALNAIAGGLAGASGGPVVGLNVGHTLAAAPYRQALGNWQQAMDREREGMKLEGTVQAQDIARQRAANYGVNAAARMKSAEATKTWREYQQAHMPKGAFESFQENPEAYKEFQKGQHPGTTPRPSPFEQFQQNPEQYKDFQQGQHPLNPNAETPTERAAWRNRQEAGRNARNAAQIAARPAPIAIPNQQRDAENLALQHLLRTEPGASSFIIPGDPNKKIPARIMTADELQQSSKGMPPAQASLARDKYRQFLEKVDKKKKEILGSKSGTGSDWEGGIVK